MPSAAAKGRPFGLTPMADDPQDATPKPPPVDRLTAVWQRVNDYKIVQWSVAYVALAYGVQHAVVLTSEAFEWPHAVARASMLLFALGLPLVMTFAWYHGERASSHFSKAELTIVSILLVLGSLLFYVFVEPGAETGTPPVQAEEQAGVAAAREASLDPKTGISLAVMPFANLSSDAEQEFFSDGMTEELITALAKIPDLRVVARESAFQYKGTKNDSRAVGQALGATYLIEGSVRKAGNRVRITAQLVKASDGVNVWVNSYDREMNDVFVIQEDIATAIAGALRMPLGLKPGENLVNNRDIDAESYQQYLRAKTLVGARGQARLVEASALLEQVVARNPNYAPAWARMALSYILQPNSHPARTSGSLEEFRVVVNGLRAKAQAAASRAVQLDPNLAEAHLVLAELQGMQGHMLQAEDLFQSKALALDPNNSEVLHASAITLAMVGHVKEAVAMRLRLQELEPNVQNFIVRAALALWVDGQSDTAIAMLKDLPPGGTDALAIIYASVGRYPDAIAVLEKLSPAVFPTVEANEAIRVLRSAPARTRSPQQLPSLGALGWVYLYAGAPERVLEFFERGLEAGYFAGAGSPESLWHPAYAPVRKTERFKAYARNAGLVEFWRARGWPDLCRPIGAEDFACN